ncbi:MAG: class I SAM-dependent methyltransferase [Gemmatimonadaceae bacterium]
MPSLDPRVTEDRDFGRTAVALGWVPAPRFLLRRAVVLDALSRRPRGRVLEIGSGAGTLLADLHHAGFTAEAVETSAEARELSAVILSDLPAVRVHASLPQGEDDRFDFLLAFEVLEHIADDAAALRDWVRLLRPGGRVLLSVPAHANRWTATDTWAGHVRRYDRHDLVRLAESCGIEVERCVNYGFPLSNLIEPVNAWAHAWALKRSASRDDRSAESGVRRTMETRLFPLMTFLPGRLAMRAAIGVQGWFGNTEWGNGFVLEGIKL